MRASVLIAALRARRVTLRVEDGRLATYGELTDADREQIRACKPALLAALRPECDLLAEAKLLEAREALASFSARTPFGEVVIVLAQGGEFEQRVAEEAAKPLQARRAVLWSSDVAALRGRSPEAIRAALNVAAVFPGVRLEPQ
jgi:hypothetical protein